MKRFFCLTFIFYSYSMYAQEYVLEGIKNRFLFGIVSVANDNLAVIYKNEKQIEIVRLDDSLKPLSTSNIDAGLHPNDKISKSWYNGNTLLLSIDEYKGTVSNPPNYIASPTYEMHYVTIGNDNTTKGKLSNRQSELLLAQAIVADPDGNGYYFISGNIIIKLDNSLNQLWRYKFPQSHSLAIKGPSSYAIFGGFNLYQVDKYGIVFVMKKVTGLKQKLEDEELVGLSSEDGKVRFNIPIDISESKVFYQLNERNEHYYLSGFLGTANNMGSNTLGYTGTYQMEIDPSGKVIKERKHLYPALNDLIFNDNVYQCYLRQILSDNSGSIIVFEKAFQDTFLVINTDTDFSITKYKFVGREHSDLKSASSSFVSMFLGKKYNASKLVNDDYIASISLGKNTYYLIYEQVVSSWTDEDQRNYRASIVSFDKDIDEADKLIISWKERYSFFSTPQMLYKVLVSNTSLTFAYSEPTKGKLIISKIRW